MKRRLLAAVVAIVVVGAIGAAAWLQFYEQRPSDGDLHKGWRLGVRANRTETGDWTIEITSGNAPLTRTRMHIMDENNGETLFDTMLADITPEKGHPNALLNDSDANGKLNTGDSIHLRNTIPKLDDSRVQFFLDEKTICGPFRLSNR